MIWILGQKLPSLTEPVRLKLKNSTWPRVALLNSRLRRSFKGRQAMAALSVLLLLAGGIGLVLKRNRLAEQKRIDVLDDTVLVAPSPLTAELEASGVVVALRRINISPASPGRIRRLLFREGEQVRAGQLLAIMENDQEKSKVLQIEADLRGATAERDASKRRLERFEELLSEGGVAPDEVDELRKTFLKSNSNVGETRERLNEAKTLFDRTFIRAPFSGIITQLFAEESEYVAPATSASTGAGATSTTIAELSSGLEVEAKIPEADLLNIRMGQTVRITSEAFPGKDFRGVVRSISPRAVSDNNVISFPVNIALSNGLTSLRPEMNVGVTFIQSGLRDSLTVPLAAVETSKEGRTFVYVYRKQGGPQRRNVQLGAVQESRIQVLSGLKSGERVFIAPPTKRADALEVK